MFQKQFNISTLPTAFLRLLETTDERGARSSQQCIFTAALSVIIVVPLSLLLVAIFVLLVFRYVRHVKMEIEKEQRRSKIRSCVSQAHDLGFPMVVARAEALNTFGKLVAFEDALNQYLWHLQTMGMINTFLREQQQNIIFFSHQRLAWLQPDPKKVHYQAMVSATAAVVVEMQWSMQNCYLWVD